MVCDWYVMEIPLSFFAIKDMRQHPDPMPTPPDGLIVVAKRDCPTCTMLEPVYAQLAAGDDGLTIYTQDDPTFPESVAAMDDRALEVSYRLDIETVPTLIRMEGGEEKERAIGWNRGCRGVVHERGYGQVREDSGTDHDTLGR